MAESGQASSEPLAVLPRTFGQYLRSFGPGLIVVLTWLGAGDVVEAGVAGGNYGYALMWIIMLALLMRFLFVSLIAKYQLCNQHGEGVLDGLARLNRWYAPVLMVVAVIMRHVYGSYMAVGLGETWVGMTGRGEVWQWALFWSILALAMVFRPAYGRLELGFKLFLGLLSASLLGCAVWVGPSPISVARGTVGFALPPQQGPFLWATAGSRHAGLPFFYPTHQKNPKNKGQKRKGLQSRLDLIESTKQGVSPAAVGIFKVFTR